jgi:hypothetical protein
MPAHDAERDARDRAGFASDVCQTAINLALNADLAVFPCSDDKRPTIAGWPERASTDPEAIWRLWHERPGPLIGVATGARSGVSVLDVDRKHPTAVAWWLDSYPLLLPTRTYRTRSGGLHLWFKHRDGVRNSQGKICLGVDSRGEGGFVVHWFAGGYECLDPSPPAPWPAWLLAELTPRPAPRPRPRPGGSNDSRRLDGILRRLGSAREGERNGVLFWAACRLDERRMRQGEIEALLLPVALNVGLSESETRRTIASAMGRAVA